MKHNIDNLFNYIKMYNALSIKMAGPSTPPPSHTPSVPPHAAPPLVHGPAFMPDRPEPSKPAHTAAPPEIEPPKTVSPTPPVPELNIPAPKPKSVAELLPKDKESSRVLHGLEAEKFLTGFAPEQSLQEPSKNITLSDGRIVDAKQYYLTEVLDIEKVNLNPLKILHQNLNWNVVEDPKKLSKLQIQTASGKPGFLITEAERKEWQDLYKKDFIKKIRYIEESRLNLARDFSFNKLGIRFKNYPRGAAGIIAGIIVLGKFLFGIDFTSDNKKIKELSEDASAIKEFNKMADIEQKVLSLRNNLNEIATKYAIKTAQDEIIDLSTSLSGLTTIRYDGPQTIGSQTAAAITQKLKESVEKLKSAQPNLEKVNKNIVRISSSINLKFKNDPTANKLITDTKSMSQALLDIVNETIKTSNELLGQ